MSALGVLAELSEAMNCDIAAAQATAEASAAKELGGVVVADSLSRPNTGTNEADEDFYSSMLGRVWVADVLLLLGMIPALVAARHYVWVGKVACTDFDADQNSWCDETTALRRECFAAGLISLAGYVLAAYYGAAIDEQWQGGAAIGLLVIGCAWGAKSAVKLSRMGGLPDKNEEELLV